MSNNDSASEKERHLKNKRKRRRQRRIERKKKDKTLSDSSSEEDGSNGDSSIDMNDDEERSVDAKQENNGCNNCFKNCAIMLKCCRGVAKIPCCATKFMIGSTCLMVLIALILAIVYGVDVANMYQRAGDYVWPILEKIPIHPV